MSSSSIGRKVAATIGCTGVVMFASATMASADGIIVSTPGDNCEAIVSAPSLTDPVLLFINADTVPAVLNPGQSVTLVGEAAGDSFLVTIKTSPADETDPVLIDSATVTIDVCADTTPATDPGGKPVGGSDTLDTKNETPWGLIALGVGVAATATTVGVRRRGSAQVR